MTTVPNLKTTPPPSDAEMRAAINAGIAGGVGDVDRQTVDASAGDAANRQAKRQREANYRAMGMEKP